MARFTISSDTTWSAFRTGTGRAFAIDTCPDMIFLGKVHS